MEAGLTIKRIKRKPMTLGEYNKFRGWDLPDNEDEYNTEGYLIEYLDSPNANTDEYDNYVSWSPKKISDDAFQPEVIETRNTMEIKNDLLSNKYTRVFCEAKEDQKFNAPHHFEVVSVIESGTGAETLAFIDFQCGPIKENGINGCMNEDLLVMVLERLNAFQESDFKCRENAIAITKIEEALLWLRKRTIGRENRGVEGTHTT